MIVTLGGTGLGRAAAASIWIALGACSAERPAPAAAPAPGADPWTAARARMVDDQIAGRGVRDARVLLAMRAVPRHEFVPEVWRAEAYADRALPIEEEQTISQPYIVALMTELAAVGPGARVLEVGTGSGYQAAVLAAMGVEVWSIEIVEPLARSASARLERLGYAGVHVRHGDGYRGWPEAAPFDAVIVTAAPPAIPPPLKEQLAAGGRLVIPVGADYQELMVLTRGKDGFSERSVIPVIFVPMTGEAEKLGPSGRAKDP